MFLEKSVWSAALIVNDCKVGQPKWMLGGYERRTGRRERPRCEGEKIVYIEHFRQSLFVWLDEHRNEEKRCGEEVLKEFNKDDRDSSRTDATNHRNLRGRDNRSE